MIREGEGSVGGLVVDPSVHDALKGVLGEAEEKQVRAFRREVYDRRKGKKGIGRTLGFLPEAGFASGDALMLS